MKHIIFACLFLLVGRSEGAITTLPPDSSSTASVDSTTTTAAANDIQQVLSQQKDEIQLLTLLDSKLDRSSPLEVLKTFNYSALIANTNFVKIIADEFSKQNVIGTIIENTDAGHVVLEKLSNLIYNTAAIEVVRQELIKLLDNTETGDMIREKLGNLIGTVNMNDAFNAEIAKLFTNAHENITSVIARDHEAIERKINAFDVTKLVENMFSRDNNNIQELINQQIEHINYTKIAETIAHNALVKNVNFSKLFENEFNKLNLATNVNIGQIIAKEFDKISLNEIFDNANATGLVDAHLSRFLAKYEDTVKSQTQQLADATLQLQKQIESQANYSKIIFSTKGDTAEKTIFLEDNNGNTSALILNILNSLGVAQTPEPTKAPEVGGGVKTNWVQLFDNLYLQQVLGGFVAFVVLGLLSACGFQMKKRYNNSR